MKSGSFTKELERAVSAYKRIVPLEEEIVGCEAFIDEWTEFKYSDERAYAADFIAKNDKHGCLVSFLFLLGALILSFILGLIMTLPLSFLFQVNSPDARQGLLIASIIIIFLALFLFFQSIRTKRFTKLASDQYASEYGYYERMRQRIPEYDERIARANKQIDNIAASTTIKRSLLPLAPAFLEYAKQERADNLNEAMILFSKDQQYARQLEECRQMLDQKRAEQAQARSEYRDMAQCRQEMEQLEYYAAIGALMTEINYFDR